MLRSSAVAWAAALRRRLSSAPAVLHPPIPVPVPTHGDGPISKGLLPRGYARMRRRIPPTRPEMESSESDADEEEGEVEEEEEKRETGVDAEEGSEEWEGFVLDFGAGEKKGNEEKGEEKEE